MQVDLGGRVAWIGGEHTPLGEAIAAALTLNGAQLAPAAGDRLDIAVHFGSNAEQAARSIRPMTERMPAGGRIVLLSSALGLVPALGEAAEGLDAAGVIHLSKALALEFAGRGILVNAIAVGPLADEPLAARVRSHAQFSPVTAQDVVNAVLFVVDPASSYLTGHVLTVDGGFVAGYARDF
jgi:NAD(P)-dependent dehydrogenase (short-subunit alcohol dehydrogenase family)